MRRARLGLVGSGMEKMGNSVPALRRKNEIFLSKVLPFPASHTPPIPPINKQGMLARGTGVDGTKFELKKKKKIKGLTAFYRFSIFSLFLSTKRG